MESNTQPQAIKSERTSTTLRCKFYDSTKKVCPGNGSGAHSPFNGKTPCGCCRYHCLMERAKKKLDACTHVRDLIAMGWIDKNCYRITEVGIEELKAKNIEVQDPITWEDEKIATSRDKKSTVLGKRTRQESQEQIVSSSTGSSSTVTSMPQMITTTTTITTTLPDGKKIIHETKTNIVEEPPTKEIKLTPSSESIPCQSTIAPPPAISSLEESNTNSYEQKKGECEAEITAQMEKNIQVDSKESIDAVLANCHALKEVNKTMDVLDKLLKKMIAPNAQESDTMKHLRELTLSVIQHRFIEFCEVFSMVSKKLPDISNHVTSLHEQNKLWSEKTTTWGNAAYNKSHSARR